MEDGPPIFNEDTTCPDLLVFIGYPYRDWEPQQAVIPPSGQRKRPRLGKPRKALEPGQSLDETTVNRIRQKAAARNLLLKALAEQLGVARSTFSNVLARREAPSCELAAKIRAFLDSPEPD